MKNKALLIIAVSFFMAMSLTSLPSFAEDIKSRMLKRLPVIVELKAKGILGENNMGYLEFVPSKSQERADVVNMENTDRRAVYERIAKQQGTTVDTVERHRAAQIEKRAKPGEWLQDANGKWYQK